MGQFHSAPAGASENRGRQAVRAGKLSAFLQNYAFAAGSCLRLFTAGAFSARGRARLAELCGFFGRARKPVTAILPKVDPATLFAEDRPVEVRAPLARDGNVTLFELLVIAQLVRTRSPKALFEIGTFDGRTTLNMAANSPADAAVFTLDLPGELHAATALPLAESEKRYVIKKASGERFRGTDQEAKISQLLGDSAAFDFAPYRNAIDFVFVDGSHSRDYVKNDSLAAIALLRGGRGAIVWHDYDGWPDVTRVLNDLHLSGKPFDKLFHIRGTSLACLLL